MPGTDKQAVTALYSGILHSNEKEQTAPPQHTHTPDVLNLPDVGGVKEARQRSLLCFVKLKNRQNSGGDRGQNSGCLWVGVGAERTPTGGGPEIPHIWVWVLVPWLLHV